MEKCSIWTVEINKCSPWTGRPEERRQERNWKREEEEDPGRQTQAAEHRPSERRQAEVRVDTSEPRLSVRVRDFILKGCVSPQGQDQRAARVDEPAGVREVRPHGETEEAEVRGEAPPPRQSPILQIFLNFLKILPKIDWLIFVNAEIHVLKRLSWLTEPKFYLFFFCYFYLFSLWSLKNERSARLVSEQRRPPLFWTLDVLFDFLSRLQPCAKESRSSVNCK